MEVIKYTEEFRKDWEEFITTSINGNFLHSRAFYDHNEQNIKDDFSLLFMKKNKIVAVLPAIIFIKNGKKIINSHARSTYGGFIISKNIGVKDALDLLDLTLNVAKEELADEIIVRNPFKIFYETISEETDYAMWYYGFEIKYRELETYINLRPSIDVIKKQYDKGTKYNTVKAWKNVQVQETENFEGYWDILSKNLFEKYKKQPTHSIETILNLRKNVGKEKIKLFGAYHENVLIAGCVIFVLNKSIHAQYIAQDNDYQEFRPINAIIDYIIDWGKLEGFNFFNLGTANEDEGRFINEGLFHFKESFGGRGVLRETLYKKLH
ncbi:GNAT family N-acetyltransferase [Chryseobacterium luquanense]|uniref:GNAT family N-acetyltransferase n=1 Tax=Chryseobacterium luquanense TaxID=2983766 RepID=A0ABT3Y657_9FLAO|nr:GNAT family N-acetyltransferase [Chryseobacterium luquanense]MCX8533639.1 GNAT family N-acetyltransferase [Chryseobacterium luquanense]